MIFSKKFLQTFAVRFLSLFAGTAGHGGSFPRPAVAVLSLLIGVLCLLVSATSSQACSKTPVPDRVDGVMIGERIVSTAWRLGVAPQAMVGRTSLWEGSKKTSGVTQFLSCPAGFAKKKQKAVIASIVNKGITLAYVEQYPEPCLYVPGICFDKSCALLEKQGVTIKKIDFTKGLFPGVRQIAEIFGKQEKAKKVIKAYEKSLTRAKKQMAGVKPGIRVAVLSGVYQVKTGKSFIRMETEKGYTDRFILGLCKAKNISSEVIKESDKIDKGNFMLRKVRRILEKNPDVIAITGDAFSVIKAINRAIAKNPALGKTKAVTNCAIFPLPFYGDADPLGYPDILMKWARALEEI
jgi:hypothetical protein